MNQNLPLSGKTALITGASQGLGKAIAQAYLQAGCSVVMCARTADDLEQTASELRPLCQPGAMIAGFPCDIASQPAVDALAATLRDKNLVPDILVNNAGIYGPMGTLDEAPWDEWLAAIQINLIGTAYLTRALLPLMKAKPKGKILFLSGGGATNPLPGISAYAASKAAIVRLAETLALELKPYHIDVNAIAPGALNTRLTSQLLESGKGKVSDALYAKMQEVQQSGGTPLETGAALCVYLASSASDGITGRLLSAPWDAWETLHEHAAELADSDIFTLRRIVPADRGKTWGSR
jgi:NAD(P)-dependent dehydrogenase (short-subunit alcohol dehydrogenase family)